MSFQVSGMGFRTFRSTDPAPLVKEPEMITEKKWEDTDDFCPKAKHEWMGKMLKLTLQGGESHCHSVKFYIYDNSSEDPKNYYLFIDNQGSSSSVEVVTYSTYHIDLSNYAEEGATFTVLRNGPRSTAFDSGTISYED